MAVATTNKCHRITFPARDDDGLPMYLAPPINEDRHSFLGPIITGKFDAFLRHYLRQPYFPLHN